MIRLSRDPTADEIAFVEALIANDEEAARLRGQVSRLRVVAGYGNDDPTIIFTFSKTPTPRRTVEGVATDNRDQQPVEVLLHIVGGVIDELEFFRYDGIKVDGLPKPSSLMVRTASDVPPRPGSSGG
jgi:hypothetical protein